jgi:hypothetical protein
MALLARNIWHDVLDSNIGRVSGSKGKWTAVDDNELKDGVQTHGGKNWGRLQVVGISGSDGLDLNYN